jgi:maltose alpha-D-glucosyltransferase/alpha-amylase
MRKEMPEISWGDFQVIRIARSSVLIIRYDWRDNSVLVAHNFKDEAQEVSFSTGLDDDRNAMLINLLGDEHSKADSDGKHRISLEPYGYRWFRVGGLDYLLRRSDV